MNRDLRRMLGVPLLLLAVSGCTTNETNPAKVSWGDLLESRRLEAHLDSRREELRLLNRRTGDLALRLEQDRESLIEVERNLATAEAKRSFTLQESRRLAAEVEAAKSERAGLERETKALNARLQTLQTQRDQRVSASDPRKFAQLEVEIDGLVQRNRTLKRWITRLQLKQTKARLRQ